MSSLDNPVGVDIFVPDPEPGNEIESKFASTPAQVRLRTSYPLGSLVTVLPMHYRDAWGAKIRHGGGYEGAQYVAGWMEDSLKLTKGLDAALEEEWDVVIHLQRIKGSWLQTPEGRLPREGEVGT